jgi:hypothetical protein
MASFPIRKDWFKWPDGDDLSWLTPVAVPAPSEEGAAEPPPPEVVTEPAPAPAPPPAPRRAVKKKAN